MTFFHPLFSMIIFPFFFSWFFRAMWHLLCLLARFLSFFNKKKKIEVREGKGCCRTSFLFPFFSFLFFSFFSFFSSFFSFSIFELLFYPITAFWSAPFCLFSLLSSLLPFFPSSLSPFSFSHSPTLTPIRSMNRMALQE